MIGRLNRQILQTGKSNMDKRFAQADLARSISASIKELQQGVDVHCCLVASILGDSVDARNLLSLQNGCPRSDRELKLVNAIKEAIEVLEQSRKAFKSKTLEALRIRLTDVLIDAD
jgi:hypothetical protein